VVRRPHEGDLRATDLRIVVGEEDESVEEIVRGVRQDHDDVADRPRVRPRVEDDTAGYPARPAGRRSGEPRLLHVRLGIDLPLVARVDPRWREEPIPDCVDAARVERVRRDGLLVEPVRVVGGDFERRAPVLAPVGRLVDDDCVVGVEDVERERDRIEITIRCERAPRVRSAVVDAARALRDTRHHDGVPRRAAVLRPAGHEAPGTAVVPVVLLVHPDEICRIRRVDVRPWLGLRVRVERAELLLCSRIVGGAPRKRSRPGGDDDRAGGSGGRNRQCCDTRSS
jgi:hypothetical protein